MTEKRIQFNNIIQNQLPAYIREEVPLIAEFLRQYYISQEFQSASTDLIQNIDQYLKLDTIKSNAESTTLFRDITFLEESIPVSNTLGFPDSYGLIQIDDEIITYTEKRENKLEGTANISVGSTVVFYNGLSENYIGREFKFKSPIGDTTGNQIKNPIIVSVSDSYFTLSSIGIASTSVYGYKDDDLYPFETSDPQFSGCIRGFSGTASYGNTNVGIASTFKLRSQDQLIFKDSESADHSKKNADGTPKNVINLSSLFLKEFFNKIKYQLTPGFEQREFYSSLDKYLFLKQSKDFYSTKGTDLSFQILFKVLYGEDVKIIKPQDYLIKPSDSQYEITNDLVVESISGSPYDLERSTLYQDAYGDISKGYAPITRVEKIFAKSDKVYYKLSIDAGYNRDINVDGSLYGNFSIHPKTRLIGNVVSGTNTLDVDSTVGFPLQGELSVIYNDGTEGIITYTSKSLNQFFGCQNIIKSISDASDVWLNVYAYGTSNKNSNEVIKVRITSVLKDLEIVDDTYYYNNQDTGIIRTLGVNPEDAVVSNNWIFNNSLSIEVSSITLIDSTNGTYRLVTKVDHGFRVGDNIKINSNNGISTPSSITNIVSDNTIEISGQGNLNLNASYSIQRNLLKVNSSKYSYLSNQTTDIQNIYKIKDKTLVASSSLPSYASQSLNAFDRSVLFKGTFINTELSGYPGLTDTINLGLDHGFYTGDSIYYTPSSKDDSLFDEGVYIVQRVNQTTIRFAKSRENIYKSIKENKNYFVKFKSSIELKNNSKIQDYDFYLKKLDSQKLLREINPPVNDGRDYETTPGTVGILINGVEILNYKSKDKIYYDSIENINIINSGSGYDIINPPTLVITDSVGTGATGYCAVKGSLQEIRIVDPGFGYLETPKINISGGNGIGAKANASMKLIDHKVSFNSESKSAFVNIANSTIGFSTYHKFRNAEKVIYRTNAQKSVGGISTNSSYYVSVKDLFTIKLHKTYADALVGVNTVTFTSFGVGNHDLESVNKKSVIASINIENSGLNYENKKRTVSSSGISTSLGHISIKNHDYQSGEIIRYTTSGSPISGLTSNTNYYVTKVDDNNFKLSLVGVGTDNQDFYYKTSQYIQLNSTGSGIHAFNYPQISVEVVGSVGISSSFKATIQPIFRGEVTSVYLENNGVGYGSSEIINFNRIPNTTLNSGSEAQLLPIINDGKIVDILINNPGRDYNSPPNLNISTGGNGSGAVLTPILENGQIKSIKIIESGSGYDPNNTFITVSSAGVGVELDAKLKSWTINLFAKYFNKITPDDGFVFYNSNSKYGLQYTHLYAPRNLRENIYAKENSGKTLYGTFDLIRQNGIEVSSTKHSPIIGWAYDGNPIYGPYGFSSKSGGSISRMRSGYIFNSLVNRPPFPIGFFVEDYEYKNVDDDTVLDEYNGRFCVTPDFPNGTYAYFTTIDETSSDSFGNYRLPVFPYIIGNKFKSTPNEFNFSRFSNQDDINLNETKWARNTSQYNLLKTGSSYPYLSLPNDLDQTIDIKYASSGFIENVDIINGGLNYKVNDKVIFDDEGTSGFGFASKVSRIGGKTINSISVANTTIYNAEIYSLEGGKNSLIVQSDSPHNLTNTDLVAISGLNTTSSLIGGSYTIGVSTNILSVSNPSGIGSVGVTGIVTFISVGGNLSPSSIRENDIYRIGNEKVKILNVDRNSSRIRVLRSVEGSVGSAHSYTGVLYESPRRFAINAGDTTSYAYKANKEIYFNPKESLGVGTISGVGIGSTLTFSNPGVGITQIFIPTRTIYFPNHNLETGDSLIYSTNIGTSISVSNNGMSSWILNDQSVVYVAKITNDLIGISTVKVGLGSTGTFVGIATTTTSSSILYFTGIGTGTYHSFKTNYPKLSGQVSKNIVTVSTAQTHGLANNDDVFVNVSPGISTSIIIKYDDTNRKVLVNPRSFISSDVDVISNSILITNHNFENGQKVVHTSTSPSGGLTNNKIYYVVVFDRNTVKLSPSYYSATSLNPEIINITSASSGTLSAVNPPIKVYKNSTVTFDLSDSSLSYLNGLVKYSAFELNFYIDSNYTQIFDKSEFSKAFEVTKSGNVGIDANAKVTLNVTEDIPEKLYYKLDPVYDNILPKVKEEVNIDTSVNENNEIQVTFSGYNGKHRVVSTSSTSFTYNLERIPESYSYNSSSKLEYETTSLTALGPISRVNITSKGQNYINLPKFSLVASIYGTGAILEAFSKSIGKVKKTKLNGIGFDFSCDFTVRPNVIFPQILKIEPLNSLESIGITSVGRGYSSSPELIVLDGYTKQILPEVNLLYSLGDNYVTILNNTYRLNDIDPIIIPTQNSNGVGISSILYNSTTKDVTATLSVGFSTASAFPFAVNDKVLVENISVGINSTGKGYNSENYNYQLFTITAINANIGGTGSVTYNLSNSLNSGEEPGTFDAVNSSGRIIPEKYFPQFKVILKRNNFLKNESVRYSNQPTSLGFVKDWNEKIKYLKVSSREILEEGKILEGDSSKTQGRISSAIKSNGFINTGSYSKSENGWVTETGTLNNNLQRIQDNFYYQNFSYSLKSKVPYDTWENAVGSLNHTAGFKKFSDYQLESFGYSGISTDVVSIVDATVDLYGTANLNCVYDFDLARENVLNIESKTFSDEILFSSRILKNHFESFGNRVLSIDNISDKFNNNQRFTNFLIAHRFLLSDIRAQKYITYVKDRQYPSHRQLMLFTLLHDGNVGYLNQYGRVETRYDLGSFDFDIDTDEGLILFYPADYKSNNYNVTVLSYNLKDNFAGVGSTTLGNIVKIDTNTTFVSSGSTTIVGLGTTYTSAKILVEITGSNGQYQFNELSLVHDGTNVEFIDYGQLTTHSSDAYSSSGLGTYYAYISGSDLNIDFTPNVGLAASISTIQVAIANTSSSGIGTFDIKYARFGAASTSIASTSSPTANVISEYPDNYDAAYYIVQVSDITNNRHQLSEVVVVNDDSGDTYITEFGNIETHSGLGTVGVVTTTNSTRLTFTPLPNIETNVKVYFNSLVDLDEINSLTEYNNNTASTDYGIYYGTEIDLRRDFNLTHGGIPIFQRYFDGSDSSTVSIESNTIKIQNHFFVTGERITYSPGNPGETSVAIGIGSTDFGVGIGTTDKLPSSIYVVKVDENNIKLARSAEDALKFVPNTLNITSVGIGTNHTFTSTKQNAKSIISIDNVIQSPVVSTSLTTHLVSNLPISRDILYSNSAVGLFIGDLIKIDDEIMKIESVGVNGTNSISVLRSWLGTKVNAHANGSLITKIEGDYNIVGNTINFVSSPYGNVPLSTTTNSPDERDWSGITSSSSFHGRVFMRSGIEDSSNESYYKNYIFDDISSSFTGSQKAFALTSNGVNVSDVFEDNAVILVNEIFQEPGLSNNYTLSETSGITSVTFVGTATSLASDINTSNLPIGGIIVSVGSTEGFGYQPLISAGATATVSIAGTIAAISIGNSGSGYRSTIQTPTGISNITVRVGVATSSTGIPNIQFIGTAAVSNGNIVSIAITNPGAGYTSSNPPRVIIDPPISYSDIPLIYSSTSSGIGTRATIDVVVGQGSSVIEFEIKNAGYGYVVDDVLTLPIGGSTGIPTTSNYLTTKEFQISVKSVEKDKFSGWSVGELEAFDKIQNLFDGNRTIFPLSYNGSIISVYAKKGSPINIQDTLLVFLNDILQVPGEGYIFNGGSNIQFTESPKPEDTCKIIFYKGSGEGVDVIFREVVDTVKPGDDLQLTYDSFIGQSAYLLEDKRKTIDIVSIETVNTNPYFGPGNTSDTTLSRPVNWYRQTEDLVINEKDVTKDREFYEPLIYPTTYLIQPVGVGSTVVYVENLRPFFNATNENDASITFQNNVTFVSQDSRVAASATAIVSIAGTISSINILNGGSGYKTPPKVSIQNPIGIGTTTSTAISSITSGIVTSISIVGVVSGYSSINPPSVLIDPPTLNVESNKVVSYEGDFGIITGISTTSVGVASTGIVFDFFIPQNSSLREGLITETTPVSEIQTGYYFVISNSNVGNGLTSLNSNGAIVGSGKSFLDGVYQVASVSIGQTSVVGAGLTPVAKVTVSVSNYNGLSGIGYSNYYGNFSWGKIVLRSRTKSESYNSYTGDGYLGISTGTILTRTVPLKYLDYKLP